MKAIREYLKLVSLFLMCLITLLSCQNTFIPAQESVTLL